jgi:hypothetical protein
MSDLPFTVRLVTPQDEKAVLAIVDVYDGLDQLPSVYQRYTTFPKRYGYVLEVEGVMVGIQFPRVLKIMFIVKGVLDRIITELFATSINNAQHIEWKNSKTTNNFFDNLRQRGHSPNTPRQI